MKVNLKNLIEKYYQSVNKTEIRLIHIVTNIIQVDDDVIVGKKTFLL